MSDTLMKTLTILICLFGFSYATSAKHTQVVPEEQNHSRLDLNILKCVVANFSDNETDRNSVKDQANEISVLVQYDNPTGKKFKFQCS